MLASAKKQKKTPRVCKAYRSEALRGCSRANREDKGDRQTNKINCKGTIAIAQIDSTDRQNSSKSGLILNPLQN
jgi:hypothetical protein